MTHLAHTLSALDAWLFHVVNGGLRCDFLDVAMPYLTRVRHWRIPLGILWLWMFFFGGRRARIVALLLVPAIALSDVVGARVIKKLFFRLRPCHALDDVHVLVGCVRSSSLPSIHALNIFTGATVIAAFYGMRVRLLVFSIATLVGFSRVYVGAHYPFDVLAGALIGAAWGMTVAYVYKTRRSRESPPVLAPREERAA